MQQAIHNILCTSLGLVDKLEGTQMCVQLFFFLSTAVFLCSSYHEKQSILNIYESFPNPHVVDHDASQDQSIGTPSTPRPLRQSAHGEKNTSMRLVLHSAQSLAKHSWKFACYHFADSQLQTDAIVFLFNCLWPGFCFIFLLEAISQDENAYS